MAMLGWLLIAAGVVFFLMGTIALLRFPDLFTRLHALTKADNLGLGMIAAGLGLHTGSVLLALKFLLVWLLVMLASASVSHLIARTAHRSSDTTEHQA